MTLKWYLPKWRLTGSGGRATHHPQRRPPTRGWGSHTGPGGSSSSSLGRWPARCWSRRAGSHTGCGRAEVVQHGCRGSNRGRILLPKSLTGETGSQTVWQYCRLPGLPGLSALSREASRQPEDRRPTTRGQGSLQRRGLLRTLSRYVRAGVVLRGPGEGPAVLTGCT